MPATRHPPEALLLMGTHCPWCPKVLESLKDLLADGVIASLETVNVDEQPEIAAELNVRTVPWVRIGPFELEGLRSEQELKEWAHKAGSAEGLAAYLDELLSTGKIDKALGMVRKDPASLDALLALFSDTETQINTRIGISAIIDDLEGSAVRPKPHAVAVLVATSVARIAGSGKRWTRSWLPSRAPARPSWTAATASPSRASTSRPPSASPPRARLRLRPGRRAPRPRAEQRLRPGAHACRAIHGRA